MRAMMFALIALSFCLPAWAAAPVCNEDDQKTLDEISLLMMRDDYWNANYSIGMLSDECQETRDIRTLVAVIDYKLCNLDMFNFSTQIDDSNSLFLNYIKNPTQRAYTSYCFYAYDETKKIEATFGELTEKEKFIQSSAALAKAINNLSAIIDLDQDHSVDSTFSSACDNTSISDSDVDDLFQFTNDFYELAKKNYSSNHSLDELLFKIDELYSACGVACATSFPDAKDRQKKRALLQSEKYGFMSCKESDPALCCP
jgi:hypothetical protein